MQSLRILCMRSDQRALVRLEQTRIAAALCMFGMSPIPSALTQVKGSNQTPKGQQMQHLQTSTNKLLCFAPTILLCRHWRRSSSQEGPAQACQVAKICAHSEAKACSWPAFEGPPCAYQIHQDLGQKHSSYLV